MTAKVAGKVVVVRQMRDGREVIRVGIANQGKVDLTLTNNVLSREEGRLHAAHDDNDHFGHGLPVAPGRVSEQSFPLGEMYRDSKISNSSTLRLGFRAVNDVGAYVTVPLRGLKLDEPKVIDVRRDFTWYTGEYDQRQDGAGSPNQYEGQRQGYYLNPTNPLAIDVANGSTWLKKFLGPKIEPKFKAQGELTIEPIVEGRQLTGWMVRTVNAGDPEKGFSPFIATVALDVPNDGKKGLESMAVPYFKSEAAQPIFVGSKRYATKPEPGTPVRLAVRGLGTETVLLPGIGKKATVHVGDLPNNTTQSADEFFDLAKVLQKRAEKARVVQFSDGGVPVPVPPPLVFRGAEAMRESDFDAPRLQVRNVPETKERSAGFEIEVTSNMPKRAWNTDVGFIGTVKLQAEADAKPADDARPAGKNVELAPPLPFLQPGGKQTWFLPMGADMNGVEVGSGKRLQFGTRGLGWFSILELPMAGQVIDSAADANVMRFRPDQVNRELITAATIQEWVTRQEAIAARRAAQQAAADKKAAAQAAAEKAAAEAAEAKPAAKRPVAAQKTAEAPAVAAPARKRAARRVVSG